MPFVIDMSAGSVELNARVMALVIDDQQRASNCGDRSTSIKPIPLVTLSFNPAMRISRLPVTLRRVIILRAVLVGWRPAEMLAAVKLRS
jgi:hypothetical protein